MKKKDNTLKNIKIAAIVMLFLALFTLPYAYYQILKIAITGTSGYSAYLA